MLSSDIFKLVSSSCWDVLNFCLCPLHYHKWKNVLLCIGMILATNSCVILRLQLSPKQRELWYKNGFKSFIYSRSYSSHWQYQILRALEGEKHFFSFSYPGLLLQNKKKKKVGGGRRGESMLKMWFRYWRSRRSGKKCRRGECKM